MRKTIDWISSLPDDVLARILSFLRTGEAVRTCILSKRRRKIWASVPVLNFDFNYFKTNEVQKFDQFVIRVLKNRKPSDLDTVIYRGRFSCKPSMRWLAKAARLMPRVIIVNITVGDKCRFPDSVFSCASLENLELCYCTYGRSIIRPKTIAFASLTTLKLGSIKIHDDFMQKLFLGCPALENLKLSLANTVRNISLENATSLVNSCISMYGCDHELHSYDMQNSKFPSGLSNATNLELYFCHLPKVKEQWMKDISNCGTFHNLKSFKIGAWNMGNDFSLVACFLEQSPVLEQLTLRLDKWRDVIQEMLGQDVSMEFEELESLKSACDEDKQRRQGVIQEMPRQDVSFQLEYLDTVNISCRKKDKLASKMVSVLGRHVKTIRNINIREY